MISDKDVNRIAKIGDFRSSAEKADLKRFIEGCRKDNDILLADRDVHLAHTQQKRVMQGFADRLDDLIRYYKSHPQVRSLLTASEQARADRAFAGAELGRVLDRIPRQVLRRFGQTGPRQLGQLGRLQDQVSSCVAELKSAPLLPVNPSAAKPWLDYLARRVLRYLSDQGKLGNKMPSENDWQVAFAREIFQVVLKDTLAFSASRQSNTWTLSAVRKRLASQFDHIRARKKTDLKRERAKRAAWRSEVVVELMKVLNVSEQEAREFAEGMAVNLTVEPRVAVHQFVATWKD